MHVAPQLQQNECALWPWVSPQVCRRIPAGSAVYPMHLKPASASSLRSACCPHPTRKGLCSTNSSFCQQQDAAPTSQPVQRPTLTMAMVSPVPDTKLSFRGVAAATGHEKVCLCCLRLESRNPEDVRYCCLIGDSTACLPWSGQKHDMFWFLKLNLCIADYFAV